MKRVFDFFSSVKLTLVTLLGLAAVAVGGTIWPVEQGMVQRFELYYQSLWFRLLLGVLALNLTACIWRTLIRVAGEKKRLSALLENAEGTAATKGKALPESSLDALTTRLQSLGYRVSQSGSNLLARRGLLGRWSLPILHIAILAIMLGSLASELGFVGTLNIYVKSQSDKYFDWDVEAERSLGFTLRLDHFEPQYYPIDLRFAFYDKQSREQLREFTTREGEIVDVEPGLSLQVLRFFPDEEHLVLGVVRDGALVGEYHSVSGSRTYPNSIDLGVEIKPTAFRDPLLKQLHSEVSILENGEVVREGIIEVNTPLVHRGVAIYQTAYSRDESGFWTCGFQLSKDPGEPLVWLASIVLSLTLFMVFMVRFQAVGVVLTGDGCRLISLAGFRGDAGRERFELLATELGTDSLSGDNG